MTTRTNMKVIPGKVYRNSNGSDYACILQQGSYGLLQEVDSKHPKFIVAWHPDLYEHDGKIKLSWQQGHYFEAFFNERTADQLLAAAVLDFQERTGSISLLSAAPKLEAIRERESTFAVMQATNEAFAKHFAGMDADPDEPVYLYSLDGFPDFWIHGERAHLSTLQDWFTEDNRIAE
jgi:hypothetical protein